jgi:hypothetical protein
MPPVSDIRGIVSANQVDHCSPPAKPVGARLRFSLNKRLRDFADRLRDLSTYTHRCQGTAIAPPNCVMEVGADCCSLRVQPTTSIGGVAGPSGASANLVVDGAQLLGGSVKHRALRAPCYREARSLKRFLVAVERHDVVAATHHDMCMKPRTLGAVPGIYRIISIT